MFYIFVSFNNTVVNETKIMKKEQNVSDVGKKKLRKVDISILREDLVNQLIEILQLVEKTLTKLLSQPNKESFSQQSTEVMNIFSWINQCIKKFNEDPLAYDRSDIELYLNQAQKYKLFLNSI